MKKSDAVFRGILLFLLTIMGFFLLWKDDT